VLLFVCFLPNRLPAQLTLFSGVSFQHEVTATYGYGLEVQNRQYIATGNNNRTLIQGTLNFALTEGLDIAPSLRVTPSYSSQDPTVVRLQLDLNYSYDFGDSPFALEARLRNQYEREITDDADGHKYAVRPRIGLAYSVFEHTEVVIEYEARYRFDSRNEFARHRYTLGFSQDISTRVSVSGFYRIEQRTNVGPVDPDPFIGLYLNYTLPNARKVDWRYRRPFGRSLRW
jgi:hypothetical protein